MARYYRLRLYSLYLAKVCILLQKFGQSMMSQKWPSTKQIKMKWYNFRKLRRPLFCGNLQSVTWLKYAWGIHPPMGGLCWPDLNTHVEYTPRWETCFDLIKRRMGYTPYDGRPALIWLKYAWGIHPTMWGLRWTEKKYAWGIHPTMGGLLWTD